MYRTIILAAAAVAFASPLLAQERPIAPALRGNITIESDIVRVGDLVENPGAAASVAIFRAPDLGETGSVPVAQVVESLRAHNVIGLNVRGLSEVIVTRAGRTISQRELQDRIRQSIAGHAGFGDAKNLSIALDREIPALVVEPNAGAELAVSRLVIDQRSGKFEIAFDLPGSAIARRHGLRFSGTVTETIEFVAASRPIARGEVLRQSDLVTERRPKAEIGSDYLADSGLATGLAARQAIRAGQALRRADLMKPEIVVRNEPVTILYERPGMALTLRGKALESAAEGEVVAVLNVQSKRTLQGIVSGPGRVVVNAITPRFAEADVAAGSGSPARQAR